MSELLAVKNLKMHFPIGKNLFTGKPARLIHAVDDVSFSIGEAETLGLVGESGCGKSTVGRCIVKLYEPTDGSILYQGTDIARIAPRDMMEFRRDIQMIFQDPYSSLNPRFTVGDIIGEGLKVHGLCKNRADYIEQTLQLMRDVGLNEEQMLRYPHEFSGGQRQRIAIARALALKPKLIICDEPVSALDVSIQAQVVNLLEELQQTHGISYLFISHDLRVVKHISDKIAVMYLGNLVETADKEELFSNPVHPYTRMLLMAVPTANPKKHSDRGHLTGELPSIYEVPAGCRFCTRCPMADDTCRSIPPQAREVKPGHMVACHKCG